jgi:hypothetical protein
MKVEVKKILILSVFILLLLTGCASVISIEYENVEVVVVDEDYTAMWLQPVKCGNVTTFITHPAHYKIIVEYNGVKYTLDDEDAYKKYKNKIGQTVNGTMEVKTFDDGTVKYDIWSLE